MHPPWNVLFASVAGTSHERRGESCQDYAHALLVTGGGSPVLVAACADGAGSAAHAFLGARLACLTFIGQASEDLGAGLAVRDIDAGRVVGWHERVRGRLSLEACVRNVELRDFATTLLTAIVGEEWAAFSQIGDGAIVYREGGGYQ